MRTPGAFLFEIVTVFAKQRRIDDGAGRLVGQLDPLQIEENQVLVDGGALFARPAEQGAMPRIIGLGRVHQAGVDGRLVHLLGKTFQLRDGGKHELGAGPALDLAAVSLLESLGAAQGFFKIVAEPRIVQGAVEVGQFPGDAVRAAGLLES